MKCWGMLSCISCARTSASTRPMMTTPEHISPESSKCLSSEKCIAHWESRGLITYIYEWTCEGHFWQIVLRIILASETSILNATLQEESRLIPRCHITRIMRNKCKSLFAADGGHTRYWRHSHLPHVTFKSITLILCSIQRNCISSFENLQLFHDFLRQKREYSIDTFCEKWLWPPGYLTQCHNKGIRASKLKEASFSTDEMYLNK